MRRLLPSALATAGLAAILLSIGPGSQREGNAQPAPTPRFTHADSVRVAQPKKRPLLALGEITLVNGVVLTYNRYIRAGGGEGFKVGWTSWNESIENGFDWDPNNFSTNQFAHPYHGSLYFNAARSNGFDFWESAPFTFAGSFQWEYFGESRHPSVNDWVNTSVGGIALGEMTHRLASTVRDNTAQGGGRFWKEFGGFFIDPVGGLTRLVTGDMSRVQPNPPGRKPTSMAVRGRFGMRTTYEDHIGEADTTGPFVNLKFEYGDYFDQRFRHPYDAFDAQLQLNFKDVRTLGQVTVTGMLARKRVGASEKSEHMLGAFQHYDYMLNRAFELGGQSFSAGLLSRFATPNPKYVVHTRVHAGGVLLGATKSDYANQTARSYDYGPGYGASFSGALVRNDTDILRFGHYEYYIHVVNGNQGDHHLNLTFASLSLPLGSKTAIGAEYSLYTADRNYEDFPDVYQRSPQLEFYLRARL